MTQARWCFAFASILAATAASAGVITVDPSGGGDYETLPEAWYIAGSEDTILMAPATHNVGGGVPGWPLTLDSGSPAVVGPGGASATILLGDGVTVAFFIPEDVFDAHIHFEGLTFRSIGEILDRGGPYGESGGCLRFIENVVEDCGSWVAVDASQCCDVSVVAGNIITGNPGIGLYTYHYWGLVEDNEICFNGSGVSGACCEHPTLVRNHIHHNSGYGIWTGFDYTVENNIIEDNGGPGILLVSDGEVCRNVITRNGVGVKHEGFPLTHFRYNDVYDNLEHELEVDDDRVGEWYCGENWWGTTDSEEIAAGIWDCDDDPAIGICVNYWPPCDLPGCVSTAQPATWGSVKAMYR